MEKEIIEKINQWDGSINTTFGSAMRTKTYDCFGKLFIKIGSELSTAIEKSNSSPESKLLAIKTILAKYNIYKEK